MIPTNPTRLPQGLLPLILISVLNHSCNTGGRFIVTLHGLKLGASPFFVGTIVALYSFLPMLLAMHVGRLIDRHGPQRPMFMGSMLILLGPLVPAVYPGLPVLYVTSTLVGIGTILYQVSAQKLVGNMGEASNRSGNFALLGLGVAGAAFIGPFTAGIAIDRIGFQTAFALMAFFPLISLLIQSSKSIRSLAKGAIAPRSAHGSSFDLLRIPELRKLFLVNFLLYMALDLHSFMVPVYGTQIGLSASVLGMIMSCFAIGMFFVRGILPFISRHIKEWQVLIGVMSFASIAFFIYPFISQTWGLMLLSLCLGMALGTSQPMAVSLLHEIVPKEREGEAIGLRLSLTNAGMAALPVLFGSVASLGAAPVFWAVAGCLAAGSWFARNR